MPRSEAGSGPRLLKRLVATHTRKTRFVYSLEAAMPSSFNRAATSAPAVFVSTLLSIWRILPSASM